LIVVQPLLINSPTYIVCAEELKLKFQDTTKYLSPNDIIAMRKTNLSLREFVDQRNNKEAQKVAKKAKVPSPIVQQQEISAGR
jgi:hypothetical protein